MMLLSQTQIWNYQDYKISQQSSPMFSPAFAMAEPLNSQKHDAMRARDFTLSKLVVVAEKKMT